MLYSVAFRGSRWKLRVLLASLRLVLTNFVCNEKGLFYLNCACSEAAAAF